MKTRCALKRGVVYACMVASLFMLLSPLSARAVGGVVATPTASPRGGIFASFPQDVSLSCLTNGAHIYYTLDGMTPTIKSTKYTTGVPISVNAGQTLKAFAIMEGFLDSAVMSETYSLPRGSGGLGGAELPPAPPKGQPASIGNCKEYVPVHERPDKKSPVIGRIALGEPILLLQWNKGETWCKVLYNGENNTGWVQREYIIPQR